MINGIQPKGLKCSRCDDVMPNGRLEMGYTICVSCSTEEKVSCHTIYPHKTGGYIQVVSKEQSENLNRLDRRGYRGSSAYRMPKDTIKKVSEPPKIKNRPNTVDNIKLLPTEELTKKVLDYYDEWGYQPTMKYIRKLNSSGDIALAQRIRVSDMITEMYLTPTPRALSRKYKVRELRP